MTQKMISIIIPAFNSGKYIKTTLDNLYAQTYQNFEIIIAYDEKSTDNSLELLQTIAKDHANLIIDIGKDTSSGCARNRGFQLAKGEYVIFVDADDEIHPQYLEKMIEIFNKHPELDVVCCDYTKVYESTIRDGWEIVKNSPDTYAILNREDTLYKALWTEIANTPWLFLVKRQYLIDKGITFPNYSVGDDVVYVNKIIANTNAIGRTSKKLYIFILHQSSITHQLTAETRWKKYDASRKEIIAYFREIDPIFADDFQTMAVRNFVYTSVLIHDYAEFKKEIETMGFLKLNTLHRHEKLPYKASVICYSISKHLFYSFAKAVASNMNNITPLGKKLEK